MSCVLCAIAAGATPATVFHKADDILAIAPLRPAARVHILLFPTEHFSDLPELLSSQPAGLAAKPIIDCDIVVTAEQVGTASDVLAGLGFRSLGELGIPERWAFKEPPRLTGTNTYVIVDGSLSLRNHLRFRDLLRANPDLRDRYGALKKSVGATADSIEQYGQGKNAMIQQFLAAAGLSDDERRIIDAAEIPTRDEVPR